MTMRFATCLVAALLSTTTLAAPVATACGSYSEYVPAPTLLPVSTHFVFGGQTPASRTQRAFAVINTPLSLDGKHDWQRIERGSYDSTSMIQLASLKKPMTVTLVGSQGARVVRTTAHVALRWAFFRDAILEAVELPVRTDEQIELAIAGSHRDAVWHEVAGSYTHTQKIRDTDIQVTSSHDGGTSKTTIEAAGLDLGTFEGYAMGAVDVGGARFVVIQRNDRTLYTVRA
jgi:hypothetical protein